VPLTLAAVAAGKHVLCEKPIALTADEAVALRATIGKALVAEAFMVRFHPQWLRARELIRDGRIGTLRAVQMFFGYNNVDPANVRNRADIGGGGSTTSAAIRSSPAVFSSGPSPCAASRSSIGIPRFRTDRLTSALVDFGDGRRLDFTVSTQIAPHQRLQLCGSQGRIEIPIPVNAPQGAATRISSTDCSSLEGTGIVTETLAPERPVPAAGRGLLARRPRRDPLGVRASRMRSRTCASSMRCSARRRAAGGRTSPAVSADAAPRRSSATGAARTDAACSP
jgi:predicted dehydrogenase